MAQVATNDGPALLFNIHLSSKSLPPVAFPSSDRALADEYALMLFSMSSILPDTFMAVATDEGYSVSSQSRGYTFNGDGVSLIKFLQIGTSTTKSGSLLTLR